MVNLSETIEEKVKAIAKEIPDVDVALVSKALKEWFEKGVPPYKSFGISDSFIEEVYTYAYNYYQTGKYREALGLFHALQGLNRTDPRFWLGKALCYDAMHDYMSAIDQYTVLIQMDPKKPDPYWNLFECLSKMGFDHLARSTLGTILLLVDPKVYPEHIAKAEETLKALVISATKKEEAS